MIDTGAAGNGRVGGGVRLCPGLCFEEAIEGVRVKSRESDARNAGSEDGGCVEDSSQTGSRRPSGVSVALGFGRLVESGARNLKSGVTLPGTDGGGRYTGIEK